MRVLLVALLVLTAPNTTSGRVRATQSTANTIQLGWDASLASGNIPAATGYKVHYGTAKGTYTVHTDVGNVLTWTSPALAANTYYFAVTAYTTSGTTTAESGYSNEVSASTTQCAYSISPTAVPSLAAAGGVTTVTVTAGTGCAWTAASNAAWLSIAAGASGTGNGTVSVNATANNTTTTRTGTATIAGATLSVTQAGLTATDPCLPPLGTRAISIFITKLENTTGNVGSQARLNAQLASPNSPITSLTIRVNGVVADQPVTGANLNRTGGLWFTTPAVAGTYPVTLTAVNDFGCSATATKDQLGNLMTITVK